MDEDEELRVGDESAAEEWERAGEGEGQGEQGRLEGSAAGARDTHVAENEEEYDEPELTREAIKLDGLKMKAVAKQRHKLLADHYNDQQKH